MAALIPDTLKLLQTVLDETWDSLRPEERSRTSKEQIGARILEKARAGEVDPFRLRIAAVSGSLRLHSKFVNQLPRGAPHAPHKQAGRVTAPDHAAAT